MKVDGSLRSLLQGVSQQPPRDRLPGQCTEQINMNADPVTGLTRRPPTDLVASFGNASDVRGWHDFATKNGNKFVARFRSSSVQVYDRNGVAKTVTTSADALAYIGTTGVLAFNTVENDTYVTNKTVVAKMKTDVQTYFNNGSAGFKPSGIVQCLGGSYGRIYNVYYNGVLAASYKTPDGSTADDISWVNTSKIAEVLVYAMLNTSGTPAGWPARNGISITNTGLFANGSVWSVTRATDTILISTISGSLTQFDLSSSDDQGNVNLKTMSTSVADTADLPRFAPQGYVARVAKETDPDEDLWLRFNTNATGTAIGAGFGLSGYWQECVAPAIPYLLDDTTMPLKMTYDPVTDSFAVDINAWKGRLVGTLTTNPDPSFIGNPINDICTFQGRLVFLSGSAVIMTRTNKHDDFWIGSASEIVDSDPVDISSTATQASIMQAAVPYNRDLTVHSPQGQFIVFGRSALTPSNASLVLTTSFQADLTARPVPAGRNIFFATNYGRFCGVREFYTEGGTDINDTRPITQHVKKYVKGSPLRLTTTSNYDLLLIQTDDVLSTLYVYQFIWSDNQKVQSAWSKWEYAHDVLHTFFDNELVYLVCQVGTEQYLLRQSLDVLDDTGVGYTTFMDERFDVANVNTTFLLPYDRLHTDDLIVIQSTDCPNPGMPVPIKSVDFDSGLNGWVVTLKHDMELGDIIVGTRFRSSYRPTMPLVKDQDGVAISTAKLRVKEFLVTVEDTSDINAVSHSPYGDSAVVSYQGRIVGAVDNIVGQTAISDATFHVPFRELTTRADIELFTDSPYPMTMLDIEWVGQYVKSGKRISTGGKS